MTSEIELSQIKVISHNADDRLLLAREILEEALDAAYADYQPGPSEVLPKREAFVVRESSNIGGEVLLGYFIKGLVTGAGSAGAAKTVNALWNLAESYIRNERDRDVELKPPADKENQK